MMETVDFNAPNRPKDLSGGGFHAFAPRLVVGGGLVVAAAEVANFHTNRRERRRSGPKRRRLVTTKSNIMRADNPPEIPGDLFVKPSDVLRAHREEIRRVVEEHHARNARVFGSVLHGNDDETSDLDLLVDPTPETSLLDIARIQEHLQRLLGVRVDVLTPAALPESFRSKVVAEAVRL